MLSLTGAFRYYFCPENVTLRYRHNGLGSFINRELHRDPLNGDVYLFLSKDQKTLRVFYFFHRKLILTEAKCVSGKFPRPTLNSDRNVFEITWADFVRMVEGIIPTEKTFATLPIR